MLHLAGLMEVAGAISSVKGGFAVAERWPPAAATLDSRSPAVGGLGVRA